MTSTIEKLDSRSAWLTMFILGFLFLVSYVDRQIITLVVEPIKLDLGLSDLQIGLVTGLAFAVTYSTLAVPLAYFSDRWSRKKVIGAGVACWGLLTLGCGLASSFATLCVARMGVGLGEAALTPNGYALAAELFSEQKKNRAMSVFVFGSAIGSGASLLFGGFLISSIDLLKSVVSGPLSGVASWRLLFGAMGALTLVSVALIPAIREDRGPRSRRAEGMTTVEVVGSLWRDRIALCGLFVGVPLLNLVQFGIMGWAPTFFVRQHGWSVAETGLIIGLAIVLAGVCAVILTMILGDTINRRRIFNTNGGYALLMVSQFAAIPFIVMLALASSSVIAVAALSVWAFSTSLINVLAPTYLQSLVPEGGRAQSGALWLFVVNLVGIGLGPPLVALVSGLVGGEAGIGRAILIVGVTGTLVGSLVLMVSLGRSNRSRISVSELSS